MNISLKSSQHSLLAVLTTLLLVLHRAMDSLHEDCREKLTTSLQQTEMDRNKPHTE